MKKTYSPVVNCNFAEREISIHAEECGPYRRIDFEHHGVTLLRLFLNEKDALKLERLFL